MLVRKWPIRFGRECLCKSDRQRGETKLGSNAQRLLALKILRTATSMSLVGIVVLCQQRAETRGTVVSFYDGAEEIAMHVAAWSDRDGKTSARPPSGGCGFQKAPDSLWHKALCNSVGLYPSLRSFRLTVHASSCRHPGHSA